MSWSSTPTDGIPPTTRPDEPLVVLRPRFVLSVSLAASVPVTLFFTVWATVFLGVFSTLALNALGTAVPGWAPFVFSAAAALVGIPLLMCWTERASHARTEYRFFANELEYDQGRFDLERRSVPLASVREVTLRRSTTQRRAGTGTIVVATSAATNQGGTIRLADVDDPEAALARVQQLVDGSGAGSAGSSSVRLDSKRERVPA